MAKADENLRNEVKIQIPYPQISYRHPRPGEPSPFVVIVEIFILNTLILIFLQIFFNIGQNKDS